jgi:NAD(P)-dependent dehydrogenase (short-subunit alcohol dehydrogenase family)
VRINSAAPLSVVKSFYPLLGRGSRIVNISSEAGSIEMSERKSEYGYCMSKAALNMLSKILRNRLAPEGIGVFAVHPGWFSSDMGTSAAPVTPRRQARLLAKTIDALRGDSPLYFDWTGKELPF